MLHAFTGLPGHGKTLYALAFIEKFKTNQKDKEGNTLPDREVFYFGINELKLNWLLIEDPHDWYKLPDNAIIVIDEAQEHFPVRPPKDKVPEYCAKFEKHRHNGHDIFLVTQDVRFLDHHVRRLVGNHQHIERKFGTQTAVILNWEKTGNPDDYHSREKSQKETFKYPKKYFKAYKSATQHTVKRKLPKILILIPIIFLLIFGAIYALYSTLFGGEEASFVPGLLSSNPMASSFAPNVGEARPSFIKNLTPEIPDIPQSAPFYRDLYKAKTFPKPQCVSSGDNSRCTCYSQQGSKMQTSLRYCLHIVENGYFDPTIDQSKQNKNQQGRLNRVGGENKRQRFPSTSAEKQYYPTTVDGSIIW